MLLGNDSSFIYHTPEGINPTKIKAIWNNKFQNTLVATREFEERLSAMHKYCDIGDIFLNLYINNLDKNLSTIDSMAAFLKMESDYGRDTVFGSCRNPEFLQFAMRGDGKVKNGNTNVRLLKAYYEQKSKLYTEAIRKTQNEFWNKQNQKNVEATNKRNEQSQKEQERITDNFKKEFDLNITEAYRQIGKEKPKVQTVSSNSYGVSISSTGWNNLDKFVLESTLARTTLDYTDPVNGKKAVIKYEPLTITVTNFKNLESDI